MGCHMNSPFSFLIRFGLLPCGKAQNARSSFSSENIAHEAGEAPADGQPARVSRSVHQTKNPAQPASQESNAYRAGRERVRSSFIHRRRSESVMRQSAQGAGKKVRIPKVTAKRTVKMPKHTVKTAQSSVKTVSVQSKPHNRPRAAHRKRRKPRQKPLKQPSALHRRPRKRQQRQQKPL